MFALSIRTLFRHIVRNKVTSLISVAGLAAGMACVMLVMLWVHHEWSYDRFHAHADRLYRVVFSVAADGKTMRMYFQPGPLAAELQTRIPEVLHATNFLGMESKLSHDRTGFLCTGSYVDSAFFRMFSFRLDRGDETTVLADPLAIVISRGLARKFFGDLDPVGKTLLMNDRTALHVSGVFEDVPATSHMQFDFVVPFAAAPQEMKLWDRKCTTTYVLLREHSSPEEVDRKIAGIMNEHNPAWKNILSLSPVTSSHLYALNGGGLITSVYVFMSLALLILVVACINFTNLAIARAEKRTREISIKKTVGSSRLELASQFLAEAMGYALLSLLLAVFLVYALLPSVNTLLGTTLTLSLSPGAAAFALGVAVVTGLLAGMYPAWILSSLAPVAMLKGGMPGAAGRRSSVLRRAFVIAQFAFSIFVITCVIIVRNQLDFVQYRDLGFDKEQVLMVRTTGRVQAQVPALKHELLKCPDVAGVSVSASDLTSFAGSGSGPVEWEGKQTPKPLEVGFNFVDEDFAGTLRVGMVQGRFFSKDFPSDASDAFVVNEAAVRAMQLLDPIGKRLTTWFGRSGRIVGVIRDYHSESLHEELAPLVLVLTPVANFLCVRLKPGDVPAGIRAVEATIKAGVPDDPFDYRFLDAEIDRLYKAEQTTRALATGIAVLAIFLSCLGLLGLVSFAMEQRTKEIGIRRVLGASVSRILVMLTRDYVLWIMIANVIAWPAAYFATRAWLRDFAYRVDVTVWPFLAAGFSALLLALVIVSVRALRSATANPVKALRYE